MYLLLRFVTVLAFVLLLGCGGSPDASVKIVFLDEKRAPMAGVHVEWSRTESAGYHDSGRLVSVAKYESDKSGCVSIPQTVMKKQNHLTTFHDLGPLLIAYFDGDTLVVGPIGDEFRWDHISSSNGTYTVVLPSNVGATKPVEGAHD